MTKTAAGEIARQGNRVNAVCPGPVDTRMIHSLEAQLNPADPVSVGPLCHPGGNRQYGALFVLRLRVGDDRAQYVVDGGRTATGRAVTQAMQS